MTDHAAGLPDFPMGATVPSGARALVLTVSDGVANGTRQDESGMALGDRLAIAGFRVDRQTVPDDRRQIQSALVTAAASHSLVISTGGTGLTPRDVTPQATLAVIDYEVPGLAEAMRAAGRASTPMADLSRGVVGVVGKCLVANVPGSPRAALESLVALEPTLVHALETLAGPFDHDEEERPSERPGSRPKKPLPPPPSLAEEAEAALADDGAAERGSGEADGAPDEPYDPDDRFSVPLPAPGDMNDPWRDLPRRPERGSRSSGDEG